MVLPPEPVSMVRPEATATVVTVSAPLSAVALRLARRPSTVTASLPIRISWHQTYFFPCQ